MPSGPIAGGTDAWLNRRSATQIAERTRVNGVSHGRKIAVIGLGYVGLPVAVAFARSGVPVIGFDIDRRRIEELRRGQDRTREVEASELANRMLRLENDPACLRDADFF